MYGNKIAYKVCRGHNTCYHIKMQSTNLKMKYYYHRSALYLKISIIPEIHWETSVK